MKMQANAPQDDYLGRVERDVEALQALSNRVKEKIEQFAGMENVFLNGQRSRGEIRGVYGTLRKFGGMIFVFCFCIL